MFLDSLETLEQIKRSTTSTNSKESLGLCFNEFEVKLGLVGWSAVKIYRLKKQKRKRCNRPCCS